MPITDKTAPGLVLSRRQKVGFMELLRSGCSSRCGRAVGVVALVSAVLVTSEPLARQSPDDILTILTRQMATFGGPLILAGARSRLPKGDESSSTPFGISPGAVEVADASAADIHWPPGKPNPFDPGMIARGAVLPIIGEVREPSPEILRNAPPPLAAADGAPEPPAGTQGSYSFAELFGSLVDLFAGDEAPDEATAAASVNPGEAPADPPEAPGHVLAAAEDEPAPPRAEVNYTFGDLFGMLADFFSGNGGVMADAPDVAPASALASAPGEAPEVPGEALGTALAAAGPHDGGRPLEATRRETPPGLTPVEAPTFSDPGPPVARPMLADAFTAPPAGEDTSVGEAAPAAKPVAAPRDESQEITGLFAWIADAFSSATGANDEDAQTPEGPDLALAELPDTAVSAGSSTTPMQWKVPDREMPAPLAELLGAPELARAAENMRARGPKEKGVIGRLADLLVSGGGDSSRPGDDGWAVKNVEIAQIPPSLPKKPRPVRPKKHYLTGVVLKPGGTMSLGKPFRDRGPCIEKKRGTVVFCLEPLQWPRSLEPYFQIDSILYQGARAIVRYDEGIATTYHILFDSRAFGRLVSHFKGRYGPPTEQLNRSIAPLAAPRQANPIAMWRSVDPATSLVSTLEIRKFDDSRGGFPDTKRGAIMLYHTWSEPIFPLLSTLELMLLDPR